MEPRVKEEGRMDHQERRGRENRDEGVRRKIADRRGEENWEEVRVGLTERGENWEEGNQESGERSELEGKIGRRKSRKTKKPEETDEKERAGTKRIRSIPVSVKGVGRRSGKESEN
jgi:hypothetical protein